MVLINKPHEKILHTPNPRRRLQSRINLMNYINFFQTSLRTAISRNATISPGGGLPEFCPQMGSSALLSKAPAADDYSTGHNPGLCHWHGRIKPQTMAVLIAGTCREHDYVSLSAFV